MSLHALAPRDAFLRRIQLAAATAAISFLAACSSDSTGVRSPARSSLAFTTGSRGAAAALASSVPITSGNDKLDLTAITVVIDRASLKAITTDSCAVDDDDGLDHEGQHDSGPGSSGDSHHGGDSTHHDGDSTHHEFTHHDDECGEVRVGPTIVDLPVDGSMVTIPGNTIPAGTFREIELRVSLIRLQGTFNGQAFDVTVPVGAKAEIELDPPVVVAAGAELAITVNLPVNTWFVKADGSLIDPKKLATDPILQALLRMKIASSIHAFEDHDHDGQPDRRP
jgi:hypothetical protein